MFVKNYNRKDFEERLYHKENAHIKENNYINGYRKSLSHSNSSVELGQIYNIVTGK